MGKRLTQEEFIEKAKKVHGDKYGYSKTIYRGDKINVIITCPIHGDFEITPHSFLKGRGCRQCANVKRRLCRKKSKKHLTTEEFVAKAKAVHGDLYDYSKTVYKNSTTDVIITCPIHGDFAQIPLNHLKGHGCPDCGKERTIKSLRIPKEEFLRRARKIHGDLYDYSQIDYQDLQTEIEIICKKHGKFNITPESHLRGNGCKKCANEKKLQDFITKATKIHNGKYTYENVVLEKSHMKVEITCPKHGIFKQTPTNHLLGSGCQQCAKENSFLKTEEFIEKARVIHGGKYDYSKVKYEGYKTEVCIICPKHGEFWQTPTCHLSGHGCNKCALEKTRMTTEEFIKKARAIHGDKYDYSKVNYINNEEEVCIICPKHGEFWQSAGTHLEGHGCRQCGSEVHQSQPENDIKEYVEKLLGGNSTIKHSRTIIPPKELDIYIPSLHIAIEYNGLYWHTEKRGKNKDYHLDKLKKCNERGIKLIQIFEDEWMYKKEIVLSKIRHILGAEEMKIKIPARKCDIREIDKDNANEFLERWHIQGGCGCTVALGCFHQDELIAVMTFKREHKDGDTWELTRFASSPDVICQGCGGKLFKHFLRAYRPSEVKSFADRRWTINKENNLYTKLGFELVRILPPDYRYVVGTERKHKFGFRKQILNKKFGLPLTMTETEMTDALGFEKIWDCGLLKYAWKAKK